MKVLHVPLDAGAFVKCEEGTMMYASESAEMSVTLVGSGSGTGGAIMGAVGGRGKPVLPDVEGESEGLRWHHQQFAWKDDPNCGRQTQDGIHHQARFLGGQ